MTQASNDKRVALVGRDPALQSLLEQVVAEAGYQVDATPAPEVEDFVRWRPDLLVITAWRGVDAMALVDALRERSETAGVPVIVLGSLPALREQAHAAGNVYTVLPVPFDLDDLLGAITSALASEPFEARVQALPASSEPALRRAADLLVRSERDLMLGWVQRIRAVPPFTERPDLSLGEFLNSLPRLLNALALALPRERGAEMLASDEDVKQRVREHARVRVQQGVPGEAVVREYQVLRDAILKHLAKHLLPEDALTATEPLNWALDEMVRVTVAEHLRLSRA